MPRLEAWKMPGLSDGYSHIIIWVLTNIKSSYKKAIVYEHYK
jgi:hypothetical protein